MLERVLIANRGEIAVRIARTLRRMGIESVGVHAPEDHGARHVRELDRAVALRSHDDRSPYLDVEQIVEAALHAGADAVHPGYGFLAERPDAAQACRDAGLIWIGPPPEAIALLGDKVRSKQVAAAAGVPTVPGLESDDVTVEEVAAFAARVGYPLLLKASAGGGGRGMRRVDDPDGLQDAVAAARREALAAFGREELLVERMIEPARHIEVQVAVDDHGHAYALGERECSLQRRHQKLIEESPSPAIGKRQRKRLSEAAIALATAAGYRNLGTVEFLVDFADRDAFFFLEMNARLQVEHPVTEAVTGLDLVELQLRIAAGEPIELGPARLRGHAIEARVCAERAAPGGGFLPATGRVVAYREPAERGVRVDSGIDVGSDVTTAFDSMLLKVIAHGADRNHAIGLLDRALAELTVLGVETNTGVLRELLATPQVRAGEMTTTLVESLTLDDGRQGRAAAARAAAAVLHGELAARSKQGAFDAVDGWRQGERAWARWRLLDRDGDELELAARVAADGLDVAIDGAEPLHVEVARDADDFLLSANGTQRAHWRSARVGEWLWLTGGDGSWAWREVGERADAGARFSGGLEAPLPGVVIAVRARPGEAVQAGQPVVVIESMKMELDVTAPEAGVLAAVQVEVGEHVARGQVLAQLELAPERTP